MPDKFLQHDTAGGFREVEATDIGGAGHANEIPALDGSGRLSDTMMPTGIGAETSIIEAYGALAAGDFVNVYDDSGTAKVRKADGSNGTAPAHGFILQAVADGADATVFWGGLNNQCSGLTIGVQYLSDTPGASTGTALTSTGNIVQKLGLAVNATTIHFQPQDPILLA